MNKKIKARWLRALRNPKRYTQSRHCLRTPSGPQAGYCCLGVLTDLAVKSGIRIPNGWEREGTLPHPVTRWAGLDEADPTVKDSRGKENRLSIFNDGRPGIQPRSFEQIANYIEKSL